MCRDSSKVVTELLQGKVPQKFEGVFEASWHRLSDEAKCKYNIVSDCHDRMDLLLPVSSLTYFKHTHCVDKLEHYFPLFEFALLVRTVPLL